MYAVFAILALLVVSFTVATLTIALPLTSALAVTAAILSVLVLELVVLS